MELVKQELDVGLVTRNPTRARNFYADVLRFEELPALPLGEIGTQWRFRVGNHVLKLTEPREQPLEDEGGTDKANGIRLLAFILDDLDGVLGRCDSAGVRYNRLPLPDETPFRVAFASDADGNALELVGLKKPVGDKLQTRMQIGLTVADLERSKHFYGELLGLPAEPEMKLPRSMGLVNDTRYGYLAGRTTIKFWSKGEGLPTRSGLPGQRVGIRAISALVPDVDALHATLRDKGVAIKAAPFDFGGARLMFVADPDGNYLELATLSSALSAGGA